MYRKIINPLTGQKVFVTGKLGKQIIANYMKFLYGGKNSKSLEKLQTRLTKAQKGVYKLNNELLKEQALVNKIRFEINRIKGGGNAEDLPKEIIIKTKDLESMVKISESVQKCIDKFENKNRDRESDHEFWQFALDECSGLNYISFRKFVMFSEKVRGILNPENKKLKNEMKYLVESFTEFERMLPGSINPITHQTGGLSVKYWLGAIVAVGAIATSSAMAIPVGATMVAVSMASPSFRGSGNIEEGRSYYGNYDDLRPPKPMDPSMTLESLEEWERNSGSSPEVVVREIDPTFAPLARAVNVTLPSGDWQVRPGVNTGATNLCEEIDCNAEGIPRAFMPADMDLGERTEKLAGHLATKFGVDAGSIYNPEAGVKNIPIADLKAIQNEGLKDKVMAKESGYDPSNPTRKGMVATMKDMVEKGGVKRVHDIFNKNPILVVKTSATTTSKPRYHILDGHHRKFAFDAYNKEANSDNRVKTIPAKVISLPTGVEWYEAIKGTWEMPDNIGQKDLMGHAAPSVSSYGNR